MRRGACFLALLLVAAAPTPQELRETEQARDAALATQREAAARAAAAAEQERALAAQRVAAATRLREAEDALAAAAAAVADLEQRRAAAEARLATRAADLVPMLPVIERLSLYPAETLLAVPMPPEEAVRGAIVLAALTHAIAEDAAQLRAEQEEVSALKAKLDAALPALERAEAEQRQRAAALDAALQASRQTRAEAEDAAAEAARRAAEDAARANDLRSALERIEADRRLAEARAREQAAAAGRRRQEAAAAAARARQEALARPAGPGVGEPRGQLTSPVAGSVVRTFGQETGAGPASGLTFQAPPGARVVSPCGGRVAFAGPFRSYGLLVIVDCGGGWHFVLAGLDRLDTAAGRPVAAGEPVGAMPAWDPRSPAASRPGLYVELRRNGEPVNPAPFLRARS
jgi:septal ring factor EnvC (AmiA/AmiB activator)